MSLLILWMLSRMTLLSWADLTYVLPVTALGYVLTVLMGRVLPAGAGLLAALGGHAADRGGVCLVGSTPIRHDGATRKAVRMNWVLVAIIVGATTCGELAADSRHEEARRDPRLPARARWAARLGRVVRNPYVVVSVALMAVSFFAFMALLTVADLSFAVPATAASYVFETVLARYVLKEQISRKRWAGALLVACGVALVAL